MNHIEFFKLQAKNLFRDYQTRFTYADSVDGNSYYSYAPRYFDIERIFLEFDWDEENFSLMKAQHLVALLMGFKNWADLLHAPKFDLELAKLLFDHQEKIHLEDWSIYIAQAERDNDTTFSTKEKIEIFKQVFVNAEGYDNPFGDCRLEKRAH